MKRFLFRLQPVLNHKQHLEQKIKDELAILNGRLSDQTRRIERLRKDLLASQKRWLEEAGREEPKRKTGKKKRGSGNAGRGMNYQHYFIKLQDRIEEEESIRNGIQEEIETKRKEYVVAQKDRMTIERLREKEYREFLYFQERQEQLMTDQAARDSFLRQRKQVKGK